MINAIATLIVLMLLALSAYGGFRDGFFFSVYALMRNLFAFLCAMTFFEPLGRVLERTATRTPPAHEYFLLISFAAIFGGVFAFGRWLKVRYTVPSVLTLELVDKTVGPVLGLLNGVVVTGTLLILWSLVPFAKYIPADMGDIRINARVLDTGSMMLGFYDHETRTMRGKAVFLLHDEPIKNDENKNGRADEGESYVDRNKNGRWDRGWLWEYKHYADITSEDVGQSPGPAGG